MTIHQAFKGTTRAIGANGKTGRPDGLGREGPTSVEIDLLTGLFGSVLGGPNTSITDGARHVLGRSPTGVAACAGQTASMGIGGGRDA
jgi:hypothetical protein